MIIARAKLCAVVKKKKKSIFIHFSGIESEAIEWKIVCTIRLMQHTVWQTILWKIHVWCGASHSHISVSDTLLPLLRHVFFARASYSFDEYDDEEEERKNYGTFLSQNFKPFGTHLEFLNHFLCTFYVGVKVKCRIWKRTDGTGEKTQTSKSYIQVISIFDLVSFY